MYRKKIDVVKGVAILAVVLFHSGVLKSGYLGVDVFFVVNGFLVIPSVCALMDRGDFSYSGFLARRMLRLAPLAVIASAFCMVVGFFGMLPDNYENLAESVIAGNLFSENILSAITTEDYWNVANDYKPLMHLWYLGVLFEFYLVFPPLMRLGRWCYGKISGRQGGNVVVLAFFASVSFLLFLLPFGSESGRFYFLQYRFFEIALGGIVAMLGGEGGGRGETCRAWICSLLLAAIVFSAVCPSETSKSLQLIFAVALSAVVLSQDNAGVCIFGSRVLSYLGTRSYGIFVWHQIILAFYRYYVSKELSFWFAVVFCLSVLALAELSYRMVERRVKLSRRNCLVWGGAAGLVTLMAGWVYLRAGVVRDVPELNVSTENIHRGMHAEYCDRIYAYDVDFPEDNGKINVLVEGVSFGRDFANCLLESDYSGKVNLSYIFLWENMTVDRIRKADYIFSFSSKRDVPDEVWNLKKKEAKVYGIGTKNYGQSNGIIYVGRFRESYLDSAVEVDSVYVVRNRKLAEEWGDDYVDFLKLADLGDGRVRVFTPDGKFISQDTAHLTEAGASWYASVIDWDRIFGKSTSEQLSDGQDYEYQRVPKRMADN